MAQLTLQAITMMIKHVFELLPAVTARFWWLWVSPSTDSQLT